MKKYPFILVMAAALLLGGCGETSTSTSLSSSLPTSQPTSQPTSSTTSSVVSEIIHVSSVNLTAANNSLKVGESSDLTVEVLPANASNKNVTLVSDKTTVIAIEGGKAVAKGIGKATVTLTSEDGAKTAAVSFTVVSAITNLEINVSGQVTYTVNAGASLTLPTATCFDNDGTDLSAAIEIEDYNDSKAVTGQTFSSKIAGAHTISYYCESANSKLNGEATITVNVTAATNETFDVTGYEDPAVVGTYGTFKENFSKGKKAPLANVNDSTGASYISATSEAIAGNSLMIKSNNLAGSASNQVFMMAFNDFFLRGKNVTYTVSFDYKISEEAAKYNDLYFAMMWDGYDGNNNLFVPSTATSGSVYHYEKKFPEVSIPATGHAWFSFWKMARQGTGDALIAVDDFVITATQCAETNDYVPTQSELMTGVTYNWGDKWSAISACETTIVDNIADDSIKTAIKGASGFSTNVMHGTGASTHTLANVNATNLQARYILNVEFNYYEAADYPFAFIIMGGGNRTVGATDYTITTLSGNIKKVVIATALQDGASGLNIYGTGASLDWYIGDMSVKLTEPAPIEAGKTPNGYEVGFNVEVNSRAFGTDASTTIVNTSESPLKDNADVTQATVTRWDVSAKWSLEWFQGAGRVELNQKYTMDFIYYVESALSGNVYLNIDNSDFRELPDGASVGFHHVVLTDQTVKSTDYFCWYVNGTPAFGTIYLASIKITLSEVVSA